MVVTDAAVLARQVDGVLLVIDAEYTRRQWAVNAKESFDKVGAHVLGVALNRLRPRSEGAYYYYREYSYGEEGGARRTRRARRARRWLPRTTPGG
jgi:Mrp family chromosome partitioning ATPase